MSKSELDTIARGMEAILRAMDHLPEEVNNAKVLRAVVKSCGRMARIMAERVGQAGSSNYAGGMFDYLKGFGK